MKAWKGLKANSDTTALKGESVPRLHGLKPPLGQLSTLQSYGPVDRDAQTDAQITGFVAFALKPLTRRNPDYTRSQNLVLACRTPQPVRLALMASLSSFRANRMSYSNRSAPTLAENCLSCSALRLMR